MTQTSQALDDLRSLPHLLRKNASRFPDRPALREKELGIWQTWTWAQAELPLTSDLSLHFIGSSDSITQSNYYKEALIWQPLL